MRTMRSQNQIDSSILTLQATTIEHLDVELNEPSKLGSTLEVHVPSSWPPGEYDRSAMEFFREQMIAGGDAVSGWYGWYAIRPEDDLVPRTLVGGGGYFGPANSDGVVEIGYSMTPEWERRGYAAEIIRMLVSNAFEQAQVTLIIAHTTEVNLGSVRALERNGFLRHGPGRDPGTVRLERSRDQRA